jgi:hypothetical protein
MVWLALGEVEHYIEPFYGSGAVHLGRPDFRPTIAWANAHTETINDANGHIANVWRAIKDDPDTVADLCDWPVNHADYVARKSALHEREDSLVESLMADPYYYDVETAAWWIWCAAQGIGAWYDRVRQRPQLGHKGQGIHKTSWRGQLPAVFAALSERLRYVRVVCGDWSQVCGGDWQDSHWSNVGVFFDPPYAVTDRDSRMYGEHDSLTVADDVRAWCIERGQRESYRIALAGYDEHAELVEDHGWTCERWSAGGGYANLGDGQGSANRHRETLYYSPHCRRVIQTTMLEELNV